LKGGGSTGEVTLFSSITFKDISIQNIVDNLPLVNGLITSEVGFWYNRPEATCKGLCSGQTDNSWLPTRTYKAERTSEANGAAYAQTLYIYTSSKPCI
jgi:hypothetical protein